MSERGAITTDTVIIRAAGGPEIIWRTRRMISLGADAELAANIAASTADLHDIERLKYHDGRQEPHGSMTEEQVRIWTEAINSKK